MIINRNIRVVRTSQSNRLTFLTKENELPQKKGGGRNIHGNTGNKPTMKRKKNSTLGLGTTNFRQRFKCTRCPRSVNVVDLKNKRKLKAPNLIIEGLEICNGGIKGG